MNRFTRKSPPQFLFSAAIKSLESQKSGHTANQKATLESYATQNGFSNMAYFLDKDNRFFGMRLKHATGVNAWDTFWKAAAFHPK